MKTELINSIKCNEGWRGDVYRDTLGVKTIGYGFAIKDLDKDVDDNYIMTKEEGNSILIGKINDIVAVANRRFPFLINAHDNVKIIVYEMCYQLGVYGVSKFKNMLKYLEEKNYEAAADEMTNSLWARQTPFRAKKLSSAIRKAQDV